MKMSIRTDLAAESAQRIENAEGRLTDGISKDEYRRGNLKISRISVKTEDAARKLSKPIGEYVTVYAEKGLESCPDDFGERVEAVAKELRRLCGSLDKALVVGLGNRKITPDSLGPDAAAQVFATRHIKRLAPELDTDNLADTAVITTGVMGQTGFESAEIVKAVAEKENFTAIIVIDALACSDADNLGTAIQLTDTGISPGSGVENARKELSERTLGTKVVAVGVPTVIDMETAAEHVFNAEAPDGRLNRMMVTPKTIDVLIERCARLVSMAVNRALYPSLSLEEITSLVQ